MQRRSHLPAFEFWTAYLEAWLDRRTGDMHPDVSLGPLKIQDDPEAVFQQGWLLCDAGDFGRGLEHVARAVAKGYFVAPTLARSSHFDPLRSRADFKRLLAEATAGRDRAQQAFREAGGARLLGV
jgi:hypothetical protein